MARSIDDIKSLIKQLQDVTTERGASEGEAELAATRIQDLLIKYHLELNDIEETDENVKKPVIKKQIYSSGRLMWYVETLVVTLSKYLMVSIYKTRLKETVIMAVGFEEDIEAFYVTFNFILNVMCNSFKKYSKANPNLVRNDYYTGFISGIKTALIENTNRQKEEFTTALAVVNKAVEEELAPLKLRHKAKTGIKPKFQNDVKSYGKGFTEGKETYNSMNDKNRLDSN